MRETVAEKLNRCAEQLTQDESRPFWNGVVGLSTSIVKIGRKHYPTAIYLEVRQGHDRVKSVATLSWPEAERLHSDLSRVLKDRKKLVSLVEKVAP